MPKPPRHWRLPRIRAGRDVRLHRAEFERYRAKRRSLLLLCGAQLLTAATLFPVAFGDAATIPATVAVCLFHLAYGGAVTVAMTVTMDLCRDSSPAADQTALSTVGSATSLAIGAVVLAAADRFGYTMMLGIVVALLGVGLLAAALWFPTPTTGAVNDLERLHS